MKRSFRSLASGLVRNLERGNWKVVDLYLRRGAPPRLCRNVKLTFYVLRTPRLPAPELPGAVVRQATIDDLPRLEWIHPGGPYPESFKKNSLCLLLELNGIPCAQRWINVYDWHVSYRDAYRLKIGPGGAWLTGAYTHPEYRGRGLYTYLEYRAQAYLEERGIHRLYGAVIPENIASIKPKVRIGFEPIYSYHVIRLCGVTWHRAETLMGETRVDSGLGWWIEDAPVGQEPESAVRSSQQVGG